ncbi:MAG TPA: hypothetical protein VI977_03005 [archaeon]|nr:hypothetical protein [archaeon]
MGEHFKALGLFFLGIIFGLLIKYLPLPQPLQTLIDQSLAIVILGLFIIAVVLFVKG